MYYTKNYITLESARRLKILSSNVLESFIDDVIDFNIQVSIYDDYFSVHIHNDTYRFNLDRLLEIFIKTKKTECEILIFSYTPNIKSILEFLA